MRHFLFAFLFAALFFAIFSVSAYASCTSPDGAESQTRYDFTAHKMYYCNGADWLQMGNDSRHLFAVLVHRNGSDWTANTETPINWTAKEYDTDNVFNLSTDRYAPTEAGYYYIYVSAFAYDCSQNEGPWLNLINNAGAVIAAGGFQSGDSFTEDVILSASTIVYLNGTTDYIRAESYEGPGCTGFDGDTGSSYFTAYKL